MPALAINAVNDFTQHIIQPRLRQESLPYLYIHKLGTIMALKLPALASLCFLICLTTSLKTLAKDPQTIFAATYKGEFSGFGIEMVRTLTHLGDEKYRFRSHADNFIASLTEESVFRLEQERYIPESYIYARKVFGREKKELIKYDWSEGEAIFTRSDEKNKSFKHTLKGNELDPALYQLKLQNNLFLAINDFEFDFLKRNKVKNYKFKLLKPETIEVNNKTYAAEKLVRSDDDGNETLVWLIPKLDYQIGRIVHHDDDGSTYEVELTEYKSNQAALTEFYRKTRPIAAPSSTEKTQEETTEQSENN